MLAILTSAAVASTFALVPDLAERSSVVMAGEVTAATVSRAPWGRSARYAVGLGEILELPGGTQDAPTRRLSLSGGDRVRPLSRDAGPRSVSDLASQIGRAGEGEGDPAHSRYFEASGTPDPD